ncbi:hypothetical protein FRC04_005498 [Tulasnella sp. 424]|nr:hypothetical protein FRC04_005498 [Tulasnella sp. 424]
MHMPPTATMSTSSPPSSNMLASAGFLSPSQESVIFFGGGNGPSPGGRGRTSTRSASSSGISDRSRSSSKISGTSSPLGSVSPSGYGSPSGSRASSVLGNRRSSTDVGVAVVGGRSIRRENGNGGVSARQSSTSPPVVSSPLATNSLQASSLGTIVANVPMDSVVAPERGGPPLSRSGIIAGARIASTPRPKMGSRASSSSSVTSTASSGSSSETTSAMRTPRENVKMVLPAAPAAAVSAPLPVEAVKKPATSSLVLPEGPRPTVIISPQSSAAPSAQSSGSRESPSAGTSMSMDARDSKLEEEMRKVKAAQAAVKSAAAAAPPAEPAKAKQGDVSDPEEVESGTFQEYKSTVPTPSNSPIMMGLSKALGSSKQQPQPNSDSVSSSVPPTPQSPPPSAATSSVSPASTPKRLSFPSTVSPGTAVITPPSASAPALTPTDESGIVGMAANSLVSSAKGMLGAIWSLGGEGVKQ